MTGGADNPTLEEARLIRFGFLQLMLRQYGRDDTDSGTSTGAVRLQIVDPAAVKGLQARVIVLRVETDSCATNPSTAVRGRAQLPGALFNDGSRTGPGDRTGDVFAGTQQFLDTVAVQAGVRVLSAEAGACPANTAAGQALAEFIGEFFNDGSSTGAGDFTGDIMALIGKFADSAQGNVNGSRKHAFMDALFDNVNVQVNP